MSKLDAQARTLGMSARNLDNWRGAVSLAGGDADSFVDSMVNMNEAFRNLKIGEVKNDFITATGMSGANFAKLQGMNNDERLRSIWGALEKVAALPWPHSLRRRFLEEIPAVVKSTACVRLPGFPWWPQCQARWQFQSCRHERNRKSQRPGPPPAGAVICMPALASVARGANIPTMSSFRLPQTLVTRLKPETGDAVLHYELMQEQAYSLGRAGQKVEAALAKYEVKAVG
jgi:hypothetical protein